MSLRTRLRKEGQWSRCQGVYMEGLGREGLLAKLNPEEGTCVSKFLLLSELFCQVSVFSPQTLALFTLTVPGYLEHLRPSLRVLGVPPPRTPSQPQGHLCLLSKKWQLFPIWGIGGTASLIIMPHHHTHRWPLEDGGSPPLGLSRLSILPRKNYIGQLSKGHTANEGINGRARLKPRLF